MKRTAAGPLSALFHRSRAIFSCSASASGADVIIATPTRMLGSSPRRNGLSARILPVGLPENLKAGVRQRVEHDADLHADRLVLHQRNEMLGLGAGKRTALAAQFFRQVEPADQAVAQKALHLGCGDQIDDCRLPPPICLLALAQHLHQLADLRQRMVAFAGVRH